MIYDVEIRRFPFILALIVALPLVFIGASVHYAHGHGFIIGAFVLACLYLPNPYLRWFGFYLAAWVSYNLTVMWLGRSALNVNATLALCDSIIYPLCAVVLYLFVFRSGFSTKAFMNVICVSAILQGAVGISQYWGFDLVHVIAGQFVRVISELPPGTPTGFLGNNNFLAAYLAFSLPLFFRRRWVFLIPIIVYAMTITHTRTAIVSAIIGVAYFVVRTAMETLNVERLTGKAIATVCLVTAGIIALYWYVLENRSSLGDRPQMYLDAIRQVSSSWATLLFGFGPLVTWKVGDQLHSQYAIMLFNYGLVGLAFMVAFIVTISRENKLLFTTILIICINMAGNHALQTVPTALTALVIVALIERGTA
jgi:hypothetical protein